jgi:hypothetical protein
VRHSSTGMYSCILCMITVCIRVYLYDNCTWACSEGYVQVNDTCVTVAQVCIVVYCV